MLSFDVTNIFIDVTDVRAPPSGRSAPSGRPGRNLITLHFIDKKTLQDETEALESVALNDVPSV